MAACFVADKWISPSPEMHACGSQSRKDHVFKPKILLVNDHPASLMALKSLLIRSDQENDYEVVTAQSGEEALRHVLHQQFAVSCLTSACREWMDSKWPKSFTLIRVRPPRPSFS